MMGGKTLVVGLGVIFSVILIFGCSSNKNDGESSSGSQNQEKYGHQKRDGRKKLLKNAQLSLMVTTMITWIP